MREAILLARFTFLQGIKDRFFTGLLVLLFFTFMIGQYIGLLSLADPVKVVTDLGTSSITFLALALILFFAITFIYREKEEGMLHIILSRPVSRSQYLAGRFTGFLLLLIPFFATGFLMLTALEFLLYSRTYPAVHWIALALFLKFSVVLAFAMLSSVFFSEQITAFLATISFYVVCQLSHQAVMIVSQNGNPWATRITIFVERALPSFEIYKPFKFAQASLLYKATASAYSLLYILAFLLLASAILQRKEI
jgi:ABC-type transport system involved in multi-copper enzyme maturation permease subunit